MTRFFYGDGTVTDTPEQTVNVQAIVQRTDGDGWWITSGQDFYICDKGVWIGVDIHGMIDYMMAQGHVLMGRTIPASAFGQVIAKAIAYRNSR